MKILILLTSILSFLIAEVVTGAHLANGIKIGEVTSDSAVIWTRVTRHAEALNQAHEFGRLPAKGTQLEKLPYEVPGALGEVLIEYGIDGSGKFQALPWQGVNEESDFTLKHRLNSLVPDKTYRLRISARPIGGEVSATILGTFSTAPEAESNSEVSFNVTTCQGFYRREDQDGHKIYLSMLKTNPDFLVHTGDVLYYDKPGPQANTLALARYKWNRIYALPRLIEFHRQVPCYYLKDDHDVLKNDAWPGQAFGDLTFQQGLETYREQTTIPDVPYRTVRWGKHAQLWFMEGRDFRSPNDLMPKENRTIWGAEQLAWLERTLKESDATFKFILSPTPIVGPDRAKGKSDNYANASHQVEGDRVRKLLSSHANTLVICGDRHWQYQSFDPETGLREFGCGPASDAHSGGYSMKQKRENHRYLKICGGFLEVALAENGAKGAVEARLIHHAVSGEINHTELISVPLDK